MRAELLDERFREPHRGAHLADGHARPEGDDVGHHAGAVRAVFVVHVLEHLLAVVGGEVDVDVGRALVILVQETLEEQVVRNRIDTCDPEQVGDDRVRRAATSLSRDAVLTGESHDVPGDQEELREPRFLNDIELALQPRGDRTRHRVVLALHRLLTEPVEHGERRLPFGYGVARKSHVAEVERYLTCGGETRCVVERLGEVGKQRAKLRLAMQTVLAVGQEQTVGRRLVEGGAMADRGEHIEQRFVVGGRVVRRRARHQRDVRGTGDRRAFGDQPAIGGMQVIAHQHRYAVASEALTGCLRVAERFPSIAMHQGIDNSTARPADDRDAVVERAGIHMGRIALDEQCRRRQSRPSFGERSRRRPERCRALGRRHRRPPGLRRMRAGDYRSRRSGGVTSRGDAACAS